MSSRHNKNNDKDSHVISSKQNQQRVPSKPDALYQSNNDKPKYPRNSTTTQSHRSTFYKARGYDVFLRTNNSRNEKYQYPVRPAEAFSEKETGRRKKRRDTMYKTRHNFDIVPVKYSIGSSQEEHTKRNVNRRRPHTMMHQSRLYGISNMHENEDRRRNIMNNKAPEVVVMNNDNAHNNVHQWQ